MGEVCRRSQAKAMMRKPAVTLHHAKEAVEEFYFVANLFVSYLCRKDLAEVRMRCFFLAHTPYLKKTPRMGSFAKKYRMLSSNLNLIHLCEREMCSANLCSMPACAAAFSSAWRTAFSKSKSGAELDCLSSIATLVAPSLTTNSEKNYPTLIQNISDMLFIEKPFNYLRILLQ